MFLVSGLQVLAPANTRVIVTLGDSITDGAASDTDANGSWPDVLSTRFPRSTDGAPVAVINMGIGSNRFVSAAHAGPTGTQRFEEDVLDRPNVTHLIIMEGINDISYEHVGPTVLIDAYKAAIARAHARGITVLMATLLPIQNSVKDTPDEHRHAAGGERVDPRRRGIRRRDRLREGRAGSAESPAHPCRPDRGLRAPQHARVTG